jgi:integrase
LAILLMFVTYLRPGEALALNADDLVLPNASLRGFALNLHPSERKEDSKVGLSDETLLLANAAVPEIGSYLLVLKKLHAGTALFQLEYLQLKALWEAALRKTGLDTGYAVLYQVRHSGPSFDRLHQHRSILEVKSRGRWTSDSSVRRYEAHARLSQEFARLPKALQKEASAAPSTLLAKLRNFSYRSLSKP